MLKTGTTNDTKIQFILVFVYFVSFVVLSRLFNRRAEKTGHRRLVFFTRSIARTKEENHGTHGNERI